MANTFWEDKASTEILSSNISGLQDAVKNIEQSINMKIEDVTDYELTLSADARGVNRIVEAVGKRNWLNDPAPVIEIEDGGGRWADIEFMIGHGNYEIDYAGGAVILAYGVENTTKFRASFRRVINDCGAVARTARLVIGTSTAGWDKADCDYLCDGDADDVEINAAIAALSGGGEIVILDGEYDITSQILISINNVTFRGNGAGTILKRAFDGDGVNPNGVIAIISPGDYSIVRDLQIDGNKSVYKAANNCGIYLFTVANNCIVNTLIADSHDGIRLHISADNIVSGNSLKNNSHGVHLVSSGNNCITGNVCNGNDGYGINLYSSHANMITGNTFNKNGIYGTSLFYANNNTITGNACNNNTNNGINIGNGKNNTITGNTCNNNPKGICLLSSDNNTITGNTCIRGTGQASDYDSSKHTIHIISGFNNLVSANNCMGKAPLDVGNSSSMFGNEIGAGVDPFPITDTETGDRWFWGVEDGAVFLERR